MAGNSLGRPLLLLLQLLLLLLLRPLFHRRLLRVSEPCLLLVIMLPLLLLWPLLRFFAGEEILLLPGDIPVLLPGGNLQRRRMVNPLLPDEWLLLLR